MEMEMRECWEMGRDVGRGAGRGACARERSRDWRERREKLRERARAAFDLGARAHTITCRMRERESLGPAAQDEKKVSRARLPFSLSICFTRAAERDR